MPLAYQHVHDEHWAVHFFEGLEAHLLFTVVNFFYQSRMLSWRSVLIPVVVCSPKTLPSLTLSNTFQAIKRSGYADYSNLTCARNILFSVVKVCKATMEKVTVGSSKSTIIPGFTKGGLWLLSVSTVVQEAIGSFKQGHWFLRLIKLKRMVRSELDLLERCGHVKPKLRRAFACTKHGIELTRRKFMSATSNVKQCKAELRAICALEKESRQNFGAIV